MMHKRLVAMLLSIFVVAIPLHASNTTRELPTYSSLETSFVRLEELAQAVKDPKLSAHIQNILTQTENVINLGPQADPSLVKQAALSVQKVLGLLKQNALKKEHHSTSSPECSLCSELSEIEEDLRACCQEVQNLLIEILQFLEQQFPCDSVFAIDHVPFPITVPGKYCVTTDLLYTGSAAAITVMVDDVTINFHNHSLTLQNPNATGCLVQNVDEFVLENDVIQGASLFSSGTGSAVHLLNVNKATIENIFTKNTNRGILIEGSTDVFVKNSILQFHEGTSPNLGAGVWIDSSQGVTVDNCTFEGTNSTTPFSSGFYVQGTSENIAITTSTFTGWESSINLNQVTGMLIEDCLAIGQSTIPSSFLNFVGIVQLGNGTVSSQQANDVIIRNSTFMHATSTGTSFGGITLSNGSGCLLENVVADTADANPILISNYSDVFATGCIVNTNNTPDGLEIMADTSNITFTNSHITSQGGSAVAIRGCTGCTLKNCFMSSNDIGVALVNGTDNAVVDCIITANGAQGIDIFPPANKSHISGNRIFGNGKEGIKNGGTNSEFYFNTVCNNCTSISGGCSNVGTPDCSSVSPAQQPSDIAVVGSNICCTHIP